MISNIGYQSDVSGAVFAPDFCMLEVLPRLPDKKNLCLKSKKSGDK